MFLPFYFVFINELYINNEVSSEINSIEKYSSHLNAAQKSIHFGNNISVTFKISQTYYFIFFVIVTHADLNNM